VNQFDGNQSAIARPGVGTMIDSMLIRADSAPFAVILFPSLLAAPAPPSNDAYKLIDPAQTQAPSQNGEGALSCSGNRFSSLRLQNPLDALRFQSGWALRLTATHEPITFGQISWFRLPSLSALPCPETASLVLPMPPRLVVAQSACLFRV